MDVIKDNTDWETLAKLVKKKKKTKAGRPSDYKDEQMLRLVILQDREDILYDTDMERKLRRNKGYRDFCDLGKKVPSHDTITRFKKRLAPEKWKNMFDRLDEELDECDYFKDDNLAGDGTDIPLPEHVKIGSWGAKSNKKKFFGLWLMTMNSTRRDITRDFNIGSAKVGQIPLMKELLFNMEIPNIHKLDLYMILDGIFDTHDIRQVIYRKHGKIPLIPYNPRNSDIKKAKNLSDDNWRLVFTPSIRNEEKFEEQSKPRIAVERENSRLKWWTLIGRLYEKARIACRITGRYLVNQMIISLIATQVSALAEWVNQKGQTIIKQLNLLAFVG
ncbi:MAG: transposase [Candidatus Aminicenantia bacterium]